MSVNGGGYSKLPQDQLRDQESPQRDQPPLQDGQQPPLQDGQHLLQHDG